MPDSEIVNSWFSRLTSKILSGSFSIWEKIFDKKGEHTRAAVSVNSLPLGVSVEVDAIFELN